MSGAIHAPSDAPGSCIGQYWRKNLTKTGQSLKFVVPQAICKALGIGYRSEVVVYLVGKTMCVEKAPASGFVPHVAVPAVQDEDASGEA